MEEIIPSKSNVNWEKFILYLNSYKLSRSMKCDGSCCRHTNSPGLAFSHLRTWVMETRNNRSTALLLTRLCLSLSLSYLQHKTDLSSMFLVPHLFVRETQGHLQKTFVFHSPTSRIFSVFPCYPLLVAVGLFTWGMEIPHLQVLGWLPGASLSAVSVSQRHWQGEQ